MVRNGKLLQEVFQEVLDECLLLGRRDRREVSLHAEVRGGRCLVMSLFPRQHAAGPHHLVVVPVGRIEHGSRVKGKGREQGRRGGKWEQCRAKGLPSRMPVGPGTMSHIVDGVC